MAVQSKVPTLPSEGSYRVVQEPLASNDAAYRSQCHHATMPRSVEATFTGIFSIGSLVFECSDIPQIWMELAHTVDTNNIDNILALNKKVFQRTGRKCLHSLYSLIIGQFSEKNYACNVSQAKLVQLFQMKFETFEPVSVDQAYKNCVIDNWLDVFTSLQNISLALKHEGMEPNIADLTEIINQISRHPLWLQSLMEETVTLRCGPIRDITTRVNIENINYFMNQIKLSTSTDLIFKLFTSPSVMGKCAALYSLLEIHGQIWRTFNFASLEAAIPMFYSVITWICEKASRFGQTVSDGFQWVKARFRRSPGEEDTFKNVGVNLPEFPENNTVAEAESDLLVNVEDFETWFSRNFCATAVAESLSSYANNCMFDAVHKHLTYLDAKELRDKIHMRMIEDLKCEHTLLEGVGYDHEDSIKIINENLKALNEGKYLGTDILPYLNRELNIPFCMITETDGKYVCYIDETYETTKKFYFIKNNSTHWTATDKPSEYIVVTLLGEQLDFKFPTDEVLPVFEDVAEKKVVVEAPVTEVETKKFVTELESTDMGRSFMDWLKSMVQDVYNFFRQNPIIGGAMAFVFSIMSGIGITAGKFANKLDKRSFWEKISGCSKDFYYLSRGQDAVAKVFGDFGQIFRAMLGVDDNPEVTEFKKRLCDLTEKAEEINKVCSSNPSEISNNPQRVLEFINNMKAISKQYRDLIKFDPTVNLVTLNPLWLRLNTAYQQTLSHYNKLCNGNDMRQRPVCVWFYGDTNIGKSELEQEIRYRVNKEMGVFWKAFTVSKGPEYLNGFAQENIIIIDDFDSFCSVEGCLDALLVMNMVSTAAFNPNIAAMEDKLLQAKPKLIIIMSNFPTARLNCGINYFMAFERRRDFLIKVSWPGHEGCSPNQRSCEHWQKVIGHMKEKGEKTFDHLEFTNVNPLVISRDGYKGVKTPAPRNHKCAQLKCDDVEVYGTIALDSLIRQMCERIKEYQLSYEITKKRMDDLHDDILRREKEKIVSPQSSVNSTHRTIKDWNGDPNIAFLGPPGVGKSFLMENVAQIKPNDVVYIKTIESFDVAAQKDWHYEGKSIIMFDDFTTFKNSSNAGKFWRIWKERYDHKNESIAVWIMGINEEVAIDFFDTLEEYDVHLRRCRKIEFSFNAKPGIRSYLFPTLYTSQDLRNKKPEENHSEFVRIFDSDSKVKLTFDSLANELSGFKPTIQGKVFQYDLPEVYKAEVDALARVDLTAEDFMAIVNARDDSHSALQVLTGSKFVSSKFSKIEVGRRILKTFHALSRIHGTYFPTLDSLVIAGVNNNFFDHFKDGIFVLEFKDISYILMPNNDGVIAAHYKPVDFVSDLKRSTSTIAESVSAVDFLAVSYSTLPNWFIMTVSIAEQVLKILAAGAVISYNIKSQIAANRALRLQYQIEQSTADYLDESVNKVVSHHVEALNGPIPTPIAETDRKSKTEEKPKPRRINRIRSKQPRKVKGQMGALVINPAVDPVDELALGYVESLAQRDKSDAAFAELATDMAFFDVMKSCVQNMVAIKTLGGKHLVHGLMLYGHVGTTVAHVFKIVEEKNVMVVDVQSRTYMLRIIKTQEDEDRCDFMLTDCKIQFPDIRKHLCQPNSPSFSQKLGCLVTVANDIVKNMPCIQMRFYRIRSNFVVELEEFYKVSAWSYQGGVSGFSTELPPQTKKGDCGSVMFLCDSSHVHKIVGMHIASSATEGFFRQLRSVDYLSTATSECQFGYGPLEEFEEPYYSKDLEGYSVLARCFEAPHLPTKTQLYKSPYAYGRCVFEPSVMDPSDPRMPNVENMINSEAKKWLQPSPEMNLDQVKQIRERMFEIGDWLGQKINSYGIQTGFLNKTTAINAAKGFTHSQPIPLSTSPGFPFMKLCRNGKRELITALPDGSRRFEKGRLVQTLHNCVDQIQRDIDNKRLSDVAFTIFGKDELIKPGKNTRTIAAAPIALVIKLRQYFHTIYSALAEVWNVIPIKVGISPNSLDWHNLASYLLNISDHGFAIDQKGFDFKIPKQIVEAVIEALVAIALCTNPDCTTDYIEEMRAAHLNVSQFRLIIKGLVYQSTIGVASGHPGTAVENSIISIFLMYDAFCELAPRWLIVNFECFTDLVALAIYGDDISCTVSPDIQEWFNQVTVMDHLTRKYGLVITNADKTDVVRPIYPLEEISFISRGFKKFNGYYVGPLSMERLLKPLNFCHGNRSHHWFLERDRITDNVEIASDAARSALEEMFFHGQAEYNKLRAHLLRVSAGLGDFQSFFPLYQQAYANFFSLTVDPNVGLSVATVPIAHSVVSDLQAERGWVHYDNRSCLNFGPKYYWDAKSQKTLPRKIPLYLLHIKDKVNKILGTEYNEILANIYKPGGSIPYHKDDEKSIDLSQGVACVTVIGDGIIEWIDKDNKSVQRLMLQPGFLYHMQGKFVTDYRHSRHSHEKFTFSLTFRKIVSSQ